MTTTLADRLFEKLAIAADRRDPCPSNADLANDLGIMRDADVVQLLKLLQRRGSIEIFSLPSRRVIFIVATGKFTAKTATPRPLHTPDNVFRGPVPEAQRVDRDPCCRCGVRADIGCAHNRAPMGLRMGL